MEFH